MEERKKETVLLITGATSDVGMSFLRRYHTDFDRVIAHSSHSSEKLKTLQSEMGERLISLCADFTDEEDTKRFVAQLQQSDYAPTHILLLAALPFFYQTFHKMGWADFSSAFEVAFRSAVMVLQACLPAMRKQRAGHITFMLSQTICSEEAPACMSNYVAVKYALLGLMRALASEYKQYGIMVNALSPAVIDTRFIREQPEIIINGAMEKQGQSRKLTADETADALLHMLNATDLPGQNFELTL